MTTAKKVSEALQYGLETQAENWYKNATQEIIECVGEADLQLFAAIIALTSPMRTVKANCDLAVRMYINYKEYGETEVLGLPKQHQQHFTSFLKNGIWGNKDYSKTWNFYRNLCGDLNVVTVDSQMFDLFGLPRRADTIKVITEKIKALSIAYDLQPAQIQSCLWEGNKARLRKEKLRNGNARQGGGYHTFLKDKFIQHDRY